MTLAAAGIRAVLLDIEGTTTPIAFVHEVLFPFARTHLHAWMASAPDAERHDVLDRLRREFEAERDEDLPAWSAAAADVPAALTYVRWLMDRDRKSPALKLLQGLIWERGYQAGQLRGQVYPDVPAAFARWRRAGLTVAIYSSGSELAQRRLFESVPTGSLVPHIAGFFDTSVGPKRSADSYRTIAARLGLAPATLLFVSDVTAELAAARAAGCAVRLSLRPGNPPQPDARDYAVLRSFDELD